MLPALGTRHPGAHGNSGETVQNLGASLGPPGNWPGDRSVGAQGKRDDQGRDGLLALFSPRFWTVNVGPRRHFRQFRPSWWPPRQRLGTTEEGEAMPTHPRPWHRGGLFGDGLACRSIANAAPGSGSCCMPTFTRAGYPGRARRRGGLAARLSVDGRCDPSHDTLAADSGVSARTVRRATDTMRGLGLVRGSGGWCAPAGGPSRPATPMSWCPSWAALRFCRGFPATDKLAVKPEG